MSFCKHIWDIYARIWTIDGTRGMPCTKCDAIIELDTMAIKQGRTKIYPEKEDTK
jgi:hypothetical protein